MHPSSRPSHIIRPPLPRPGYSSLSMPAPRNLILSVSSPFVASFQALPNQSQKLIRYLWLSFSASLLVAHLICRCCPDTDTGPLSCLVLYLFSACHGPSSDVCAFSFGLVSAQLCTQRTFSSLEKDYSNCSMYRNLHMLSVSKAGIQMKQANTHKGDKRLILNIDFCYQ